VTKHYAQSSVGTIHRIGVDCSTITTTLSLCLMGLFPILLQYFVTSWDTWKR